MEKELIENLEEARILIKETNDLINQKSHVLKNDKIIKVIKNIPKLLKDMEALQSSLYQCLHSDVYILMPAFKYY